MMRLPRFHYHAPKTVADAAAMLADFGAEAKVVAGGTDLFPNMKRRQQTPLHVIGLRGVAGLRGLSGDLAKGATLGAMTTLTAIESDAALAKAFPALTHAASTVSTPPLRTMGTIGGNLCLDTRCNYYDQNYEWRKSIDFCMKKDGGTCWVAPGSERCWAVSSSDTAPVLSALGAQVTLVSKKNGERRIPVTDLFHDDGIRYLSKAPDELLTAVHLPANDGRTKASYWKLRRRGSFDFPVLGVAVAVTFSTEKRVEKASIVIGGVGSRPRVADAAGLVGKTLGEDAIREASQKASLIARPLDNTDFEMGWRRQMAREYVARALRDVAKA
ncbi:MAG TPA: FAD binding domain-containing protein [bacterium]|nr:FAD binding domain-containing protein [bacterium]